LEPPARPAKANKGIDNLSLWPENLRAAVQTYGAESVNKAGLQTLGYPGILALSAFEVRKIFDYLKRRT
jgi:hypothetical protein